MNPFEESITKQKKLFLRPASASASPQQQQLHQNRRHKSADEVVDTSPKFTTTTRPSSYTYKRRYYYRPASTLSQPQPQPYQPYQRGRKFMFQRQPIRHIVCSNCNGKGHFFKDCKKPILSYGMLAWTLRATTSAGVEGLKAAFANMTDREAIKQDPSAFIEQLRALYRTSQYELQVCLIQRRHTISFEAFVRGKYSNESELDIHRERMTVTERDSIKAGNWDALYDEVMSDKDIRYIEKEKRKARSMFDAINVQEFFQHTTTSFTEPSWEFPKGRRFVNESDMDCALREFEEETNIPIADVVTYNPESWCVEEFCGTNQKTYRNKYYIGLVHPFTSGPFVDDTNPSQTSEVKNVAWYSLQSAMNVLHSYCVEKKEALQQSHDQLVSFLNLS